MPRFIRILVLAILSLSTSAFTEELKIGVILPFSGDFASIGQEVQRGLTIAQKDLEKQNYHYLLTYEDDQSLKPSAAVSAARKLLNSDHVDLGLTLLVEQAHPVAPIFTQHKTPLMLLWDSNHFIQGQGDYVFSNGFSTEQAGSDMACFARKSLGLKTVALLRHVDPWAEVIGDAFRKRFEGIGGKIVYDERLEVTETDYRVAILRIKELSADGVYFPMLPMNSISFLKQAKQLKLEKPLMTGDPLLKEVIREAGAAAENVYFTNFYTDHGEMLSSRYLELYNEQPQDIALVAVGYDGLMKVHDARVHPGMPSILAGFQKLFGPQRTARRRQRLYQVSGGETIPLSTKACAD